MKKHFALLVFVSTLFIIDIFASTAPTILQQMENVNKYWRGKTINDDALQKRILLKDETSLIKMHLSLVEHALRNSCTANLSADQKRNRLFCLDILHDYITKGIFPKNLYHKNRTPYFIDPFGTACAVGQLIISSGNEAFAKKISLENNNGYISELDKKYPELKSWAAQFGFTTDELAWIQPTYALLCDTGCIIYVEISVGIGTGPFTYLWSSGETTNSISNQCPSTTVACVVHDGNGDIVPAANCMMYFCGGIITGVNQVLLPPGTPLYFNTTSTPDNGGCNGSAEVLITMGTPPYTFFWDSIGVGSASEAGLCSGIYNVTVQDQMGCLKTGSVYVNDITGIPKMEKNSISIFPNPANENLSVKISSQPAGISIFNIYDATGNSVVKKIISGQETEIDISSLPIGPYTLTIENEKRFFRKSFLRNN